MLAAASGALPELVESADRLADPYVVNSLVAALQSLERSSLARPDAAGVGRRRAAGFAAEAANALCGVYRRLGLPLADAAVLQYPSAGSGSG